MSVNDILFYILGIAAVAITTYIIIDEISMIYNGIKRRNKNKITEVQRNIHPKDDK